MKLYDVLFNWLQISIVFEARPTDKSAKETVLFFEQILKEDYNIIEVNKELIGEDYKVIYLQNEEKKAEAFQRILADKLLQDILAEPKYN